MTDDRLERYSHARKLVELAFGKGEEWLDDFILNPALFGSYGGATNEIEKEVIRAADKTLTARANLAFGSFGDISARQEKLLNDRRLFDAALLSASLQLQHTNEISDSFLKDVVVKYLAGEITPPPKKRGLQKNEPKQTFNRFLLILARSAGIPWSKNPATESQMNSVDLVAEVTGLAPSYLEKDVLPNAKAIYSKIKELEKTNRYPW